MSEFKEEQQNPYAPPTTDLRAKSTRGSEKAGGGWIVYAIALYLACYAAWCFWFGFRFHMTVLVIEGLVLGADAIGLALKMPWSRWLFYALSIAFVGSTGWKWSYYLMHNGWPFDSWVMSVGALFPLALTVLVISVGSIYLPRFFDNRNN